MSVTFKMGANWQCKKCNETFSIVYDADAPMTGVLTQVLETHKKKSLDCTAASGFKQTDLFMKAIEVKE